MKRWAVTLGAILTMGFLGSSGFLFSPKPVSVAEVVKTNSVVSHLLTVSVTILAGDAEGSGVCFTRTATNGHAITYVWTAAHVVSQSVHEDPFRDVQVMKTFSDNGRIIGKTIVDAEVIRVGDEQTDLALLRVRQPDYIRDSVEFYQGELLEPGAPLYHVGSYLGQPLSGSVAVGMFSTSGRIIANTVLDQIAMTVMPGSSGGGVYLLDGRCVGILVRATPAGTVGFMVPVRVLRVWAKEMRIEYATDFSAPLP